MTPPDLCARLVSEAVLELVATVPQYVARHQDQAAGGGQVDGSHHRSEGTAGPQDSQQAAQNGEDAGPETTACGQIVKNYIQNKKNQ